MMSSKPNSADQLIDELTEAFVPAKTRVCVIGLGYIGLPTASVLATKGFHVFGMDVRADVVDTINDGRKGPTFLSSAFPPPSSRTIPPTFPMSGRRRQPFSRTCSRAI